MSTDMDYDVIVVGAGVIGSATAYHLVKSNYNTLLLEQFTLPHSRGSSHGQSRITRKAYTGENGTLYAEMVTHAYKMWSELEKAEAKQVYNQKGLLMISTEEDGFVRSSREALRNINAPYDDLSHSSLKKRFPMFRLTDDFVAVYDPAGGLLRPDVALHCFWNQIEKGGGKIHDGEAVTGITPGHRVTVTTTKGQYMCKSVVLCLGPWSSRLIQPLGIHIPLKPLRISVLYWKTKTDQFSKMPCFSGIFRGLHVYGMPSYEYPKHVKICYHTGPEIDPDVRDSDEALQKAKEHEGIMRQFIKEYFPGLEPEPSIQEVCIYTMTPDDNFVMDTHPYWKNIVVGAGFSGHGFKLAPVVGDILKDLATKKTPAWNMAPFKLDRFSTKNAKL